MTHSFPTRRSSDLVEEEPEVEEAAAPVPGVAAETEANGDRKRKRRRRRRGGKGRSEEHTSELQSLMRISYAVFCLKKKKAYRHTSDGSYILHRPHHTRDNKLQTSQRHVRRI